MLTSWWNGFSPNYNGFLKLLALFTKRTNTFQSLIRQSMGFIYWKMESFPRFSWEFKKNLSLLTSALPPHCHQYRQRWGLRSKKLPSHTDAQVGASQESHVLYSRVAIIRNFIVCSAVINQVMFGNVKPSGDSVRFQLPYRELLLSPYIIIPYEISSMYSSKLYIGKQHTGKIIGFYVLILGSTIIHWKSVSLAIRWRQWYSPSLSRKALRTKQCKSACYTIKNQWKQLYM